MTGDDERFVIEYLPADAILREAQRSGYGTHRDRRSIYDCIEVDNLREDRLAASLESAVARAKEYISTEKHFGGGITVRREVLLDCQDDIGNVVGKERVWEVERYYEVDETGVVNEFRA